MARGIAMRRVPHHQQTAVSLPTIYLTKTEQGYGGNSHGITFQRLQQCLAAGPECLAYGQAKPGVALGGQVLPIT